jgi:hypothetical protein
MGRTIPHMTERCIKLLQQAWSLTADERADWAASLLDRLEASQDPEAESVWQQEISQRAADLDSGAAETIPWREAQSKVLWPKAWTRRALSSTKKQHQSFLLPLRGIGTATNWLPNGSREK